jgi:hypothetical protein
MIKMETIRPIMFHQIVEPNTEIVLTEEIKDIWKPLYGNVFFPLGSTGNMQIKILMSDQSLLNPVENGKDYLVGNDSQINMMWAIGWRRPQRLVVSGKNTHTTETRTIMVIIHIQQKSGR